MRERPALPPGWRRGTPPHQPARTPALLLAIIALLFFAFDGFGRSVADVLGPDARAPNAALRDRAIEELFTLVAQTGPSRATVILAPNDLRTEGAIVHDDAPVWVGQLYRSIKAALANFPARMER